MFFLTLTAFAMFSAFVAGVALALCWPVPEPEPHGLPEGHPLLVLPGTRLIDGGEFR